MMLSVQDLRVAFARERGAPVEVVHGISFDLEKGETLGIVGESGSGKSVLSLATMGLLPRTARTSGKILLEGEDILTLPEKRMCALRGRKIGMIFQEPMTALNPAMRVGDQIAEGLILHKGLSKSAARAEALRLLNMVQIPRASERIDSFPHEMSGGQRQRVGIAIALALQPELLIADEPTTALDVTVQAEVLDILDDLVTDLGISLILISHDLGVIGRIADRTLVMYRGDPIEQGETARVLRAPSHDYTRKLISAMPRRVRNSLQGVQHG
ncbi:ATP-binding cassette domain-containing protein [Ketogulonicigenium vulgare]|uniref:ABC transporter nucleotide binding/ATPase protein (Oligopeptide) n=1 Tax=Ketogulonicigenium vulgare (strain WSH-001) TaxID=759362 RepID=F9Y5M2_KETVW|nr:ABC transporter ATP-binding protein [Ketogulonicigenium vulgare]ADO42581.1 oligopeptide/dipeptide ABC transporter ATP-binding protein [Ketogulonicigenium vulgare Y25]AEM40775.1 ABC transporter nucleotide binding/ATPase protein (Oligopeptide) [Ketogulonicigenium vulgare WSH-001]ALJ80942.1 peptide ABC transporter ATP-binding protein [Ketogulonicigenium vulgare]ANW33712.1 peptide ABC transporter ATP-binding protein [Ketogulonicigenium vulgare]AOZ54493.1 oligopeptide/dipeptide ABC transporter A